MKHKAAAEKAKKRSELEEKIRNEYGNIRLYD